jgi:hypothetical protein
VEEYRLGICDHDTGYMMGLMDYMNMCADIPFHVSVFTSVQDMTRDVEEGRVDMLLVDDTVEIKQADMPIVRLTEYGENAEADGYLFKYQSMRNISDRLCSIAKKHVKTVIAGSGGFYAVYSPVGRCGVSTYAMRLAGENEDSLLIKLENFRSSAGSDDDAFMYYLLSHNDEIGNVIRSMVTDDKGVKVVEGPLSYQDIRELKRSDIEWLKGFLSQDKSCGTVVFDIGSGALGSFDVLLAFDIVYVPYIAADGKADTFKKLIGYGSGGEYDKKLKFVDMEE